MMLILSDYDQTLCFRGRVNIGDIEAIKKLIVSGNIMAISSSRNYESLYTDVKSHNIPFSFLCCNNGNAIFEGSRLIDHNPLNGEEQSAIRELIPLLPKSAEINQFDAYGTLNKNAPVYYRILLPENEAFEKYASFFSECGIETDYFMNYGLLFSKSRSKSYAGRYLANYCNISPEEVFAIGDGDNDYEMLRDFNGYSFPWRSDILKQLEIPIVNSVSDMIGSVQRVLK